MLHGWAQNVHVFSNRGRKLTKRLNKAGYRVVFLQGPHRLPPIADTCAGVGTTEGEDHQKSCNDGTKNPSREYAYAWFLYDDSCGDDPSATNNLKPSPTGDFRGMDASLEYLSHELRKEQRELQKTTTGRQVVTSIPLFLLGFSQGAVLVHKVATEICQGDTNVHDSNSAAALTSYSRRSWPDIQKCILVSGFSYTTSILRNSGSNVNAGIEDHEHCSGSHQSSDSGNDKNRRTIPSFHVVGKNDHRVSPCLSLELYSLEPCFGGESSQQKVLWEHDRGHVLPQNREFCERLLKFLS